jgi:biotin carboxylase
MRGNPRLLFLGAGPWQLSFIRAARRLGLDLVVADGNATAPGLALAPRTAVVNIADPTAIATLARELGPDAIVTGAADVGVRTLAAVAKAAPDLPVFSPADGDWRFLLEKDRVLDRLAAARLAVPAHALVGDADEARAAARRFGLPIICKPTDGAGGRGVARADTTAAIDAAYASSRAAARHGRVLVESFIDGPGVGFEGFVANGRLLFGAVLDECYRADFPSPTGHALPTTLPAAIAARVHALAEQVVTALGLVRGPFNLDLRLRGDEPVFIELNPRAGGAAICDLLRYATGFDPAEALFQAALGRPIAPPRDPIRPAAVRLLGVSGGGLIEAVKFDPTGLAIVDHAVHVTAGSRKSAEIPWVGWLLTGGETTAAAVAAAETAGGRLSVRLGRTKTPLGIDAGKTS